MLCVHRAEGQGHTAQAQALHATLAKTDFIRHRSEQLCLHLGNENRQLFEFKRLPRVGVPDLETHHEVIHALIDCEQQETLKEATVVALAIHLLDRDVDFKLSMQTLQCSRMAYHRHEADKLRLLWAYLIRETKRTKFSGNLVVWSLKQHCVRKFPWKVDAEVPAVEDRQDVEMPEMPEVEIATSSALEMPEVATSSAMERSNALSALPPFPEMTVADDTSDDEPQIGYLDFSDLSPLSSLPGDVTSDDEPQITGVKLAPLVTRQAQPAVTDSPRLDPGYVPSSPPPLAPPPDSPVAASLVPANFEPAGGACLEDGYLPYSPEFFNPLPPSCPVGLRTASHIDRTPRDLEVVIKELKSGAEHVPKNFINKRCAALKRAKAKKGGAVQKRPAAAHGALPPNALAAAVHKRPAAAERGLAPKALKPAAAAHGLPDFSDPAESLQSCLEFCIDPSRVEVGGAKSVRTRASVQHGSYLVQVFSGSEQVAVVSEKQFGSQDGAIAAGKVLAEVYSLGATRADLQRCKINGCLFGVKCGLGHVLTSR